MTTTDTADPRIHQSSPADKSAEAMTHQQEIWKARFRAVGLPVLAFFAAAWTIIGATLLPDAYRPTAQIGGLLISLLIALPSILVARAAGQLSGELSAEVRALKRRYTLLTVTEVGALVTAFSLLQGLGAPLLIAPVSALIVGLHFLPMASIRQTPIYYATGAALLGFGLIGALGAANHLDFLGGGTTLVATACFGSALTLWATGLINIVMSARMLRRLGVHPLLGSRALTSAM